MTDPVPAKRLLYVITKASWGGAQKNVFDLAVAAKERGYEVAVAYGTPGLLAERLQDAGIPTRALPSLERNFNLKGEWESFKVLRSLMREYEPDIVHVHSSKGGLAVLAARVSGVKRVIFTAHGWAFNEDRPWWHAPIIRAAYAATLLLAHETIAVSEAVKRDMSWLPFAKITVVRNAVEAPELLPKDEARANLVLDMQDAVWIGMVAELHRTKRVEDAIDALVELKDIHPRAMLVVLGEGEARDALEERIAHYGIADRVRLVGFVPDASSYLSAFDLFLMPSRTEALGLALLEAAHAGLPSIASRVGGIPEVVRHKHTGLLVPRENPHALARAIRTLLENPDEAATYGTTLKERVETAFAKERMLDETFALYA